MSVPPSVLICGKIRDEEQFGRDLDIYQDWLDQGLVRRIVFSGWLSDASHPLMARMQSMGIRIVLAHEPVIRGVGHIFHQIKALHFGLLEFEPDEVVFRARTDKIFLGFSMAELSQSFQAAALPEPGSPFQRRLMIFAVVPLQPFFFTDISLMGLAGDLHKLVSFDMWYELDHGSVNPEQVFHLPPYLDVCPATRYFARVNPGFEHQDADLSVAIYRYLLTQDLFLLAVAEGLAALRANYLLGWAKTESWTPPPASTVEGLLQMPFGDPSDGIWMTPNSNNLEVDNSAAIEFMIDLPISDDDARTLRFFMNTPTPSSESLARLASELASGFVNRFPDRQNPPAFPFESDGRLIIPPRVQMVAGI